MAVNSIRPQGTMNLFSGNRGAQTAPAAADTPEERPQSKVWLNIGYMTTREIITGTGKNAVKETVEELVSFPVNLAIDTMRKREYPWRKGKVLTPAQKDLKDMIDASNLLLDIVQNAAESMEPGTSQTMDGFSIVLQRLDEATEEEEGAAPEENSRAAQISHLFGAKKE